MREIVVSCRNLTKNQINEEIVNRTRNLINVKLEIVAYKYEDFTELTLPTNVDEFSCFNNRITSFTGLTLPPSITTFNCSHNQITSFDKLSLPSSLTTFNCSSNKITSFNGLMLPPSVTMFICINNQITSFAGLKLTPDIVKSLDSAEVSLKGFYCDRNQITSLSDLILPSSLEVFECPYNKITIVKDFTFPIKLVRLLIDSEVKFINPKFNSVLKQRLKNKVELDNQVKLTRDELIFIYLNFTTDPNPEQSFDISHYQQYESLMQLINL